MEYISKKKLQHMDSLSLFESRIEHAPLKQIDNY